MLFFFPAHLSENKETEKAENKRKAVEREVDGDIKCSLPPLNNPQRSGKEARNQGNNRNHPDHSHVEIYKNT